MSNAEIRPGFSRPSGRRLYRLMIGIPVVGIGALIVIWGVLAIYYAGPHSLGVRLVLAALFAVICIVLLLAYFRQKYWQALLGFTLVLAAMLIGWNGITPSNDRDWKTEVALLPHATFDGDRILLHNIRNFEYRSETDFTPRYYDKIFDLRQLASVDLFASYWAGPAIAHIFLSFGFESGDYLTISIERRDERGEGYSTIKGLFRQYELTYVVADERDVVRLRTNYRRDPPEQVFLYRLQGNIDDGRQLLQEYLTKMNSLTERPEFYNTLTTNCTINIWLHTLLNPSHVPFSWKILASGYLPEYLYQQGRLDNNASFAELQKRGHINDLAMQADQAVNFSEQIRARLPDDSLPNHYE